MRVIFGVLLLLNVALLMWGEWYAHEPAKAEPSARPPVNADRIRLLTELATGTPAPIARSGPAAAKAPPTNQLCASLGPFMNSADADVAEGQVARAGFGDVQRRSVGRDVAAYRVYLPPLPTRQAAERKRAQLAQLGFREHYILDEPGRENAISLGVFSLAQNAHALIQNLAKKGINAKQETLHNTETTYWLDLEGPSDRLATLGRQAWVPPGVGLRSNHCKPGGGN
jgi:cell division septation protein DedD